MEEKLTRLLLFCETHQCSRANTFCFCC